jgi:hypothetical protein
LDRQVTEATSERNPQAILNVLRVAPSPLDHENRKAPISKPAANAQRPNVQAETTRTKLRRSCGISWDRSVIAAVPPEQHLLGPSFTDGAASRPPGPGIKPQIRPPSVRLPTLSVFGGLA